MFVDTLGPQIGKCTIRRYAGPELLRAPLTADEIARNAKWDAEAAQGLLRTFRHRGEILSPVLDEWVEHNLITTVGKQLLLDRWWGVSGAGVAMTSLSAGTSNTAAAVGNTSLTGQVNQAFDSTPTRAMLTVTAISTFAAGTATFAWAEIGSWNGTTLASRIAPVGPYTKSATDIFTLTYQVVQS